MAMVTTTEAKVQPSAEKKMRRQWKSFNIDRSISAPGQISDINKTSNIGGESPCDSPILEDFFSNSNFKVNGESYG